MGEHKPKLWQVWAVILRAEGKTYPEIAKTFRKSLSSVHYHCAHNGKDKPLAKAKRQTLMRNLMTDPQFKDCAWVSWLSEHP